MGECHFRQRDSFVCANCTQVNYWYFIFYLSYKPFSLANCSYVLNCHYIMYRYTYMLSPANISLSFSTDWELMKENPVFLAHLKTWRGQIYNLLYSVFTDFNIVFLKLWIEFCSVIWLHVTIECYYLSSGGSRRVSWVLEPFFIERSKTFELGHMVGTSYENG